MTSETRPSGSRSRTKARADRLPGSNEPSEWHELILGLLDAGEMLIDDVSLIEDPHGPAIERMQNGTFEQGIDHWRMLGNHGQHGLSQVVPDPDNPQNHVLHLVATGATEHMHNHAETTLANGARIQASKTYRISFRAKWLAGSPQLNSRLYFNRLAETTILPITTHPGTPGAAEHAATGQHRADVRRPAVTSPPCRSRDSP